ncbi:hypothetical protein ACFS2C_27720 [Prauserella oleivorans]|uniref:DUF4352 domain-containing protein n=1 Tax=Prauserella oleivorans TaxID=1478153 RepID=A0ABW5WHI8_9PSEU
MAALAVGLSACGSEEETATAATSEPPATTASSETSAAEPSEPSTPAGDIGPAKATAPGTELEVGETATVPFEYTSDKTGTIAITVTAIEQGQESGLAEFGERAKGLVPYFIKYKIENVGGTDLSYANLDLRAVTADGRSTGVVIAGDVPGKCESETADKDFTTAGATFETCNLQASRAGVEVTGAEFDEGDEYSDNPVVWTK